MGSAVVDDLAHRAELTFSADGGKNYMAEGMVTYKATDADGKETDKKATPTDYTHLKWTVTKAIPAGGTGTYQFKAKVN